MKRLLLLILIVVGSLTIYAQDATKTEYPIIEKVKDGYTYDWPYLHIFKDTTTYRCQVYHLYPHKMFLSINAGKASKIRRKEPRTVWINEFTITLVRKKRKYIYNFK